CRPRATTSRATPPRRARRACRAGTASPAVSRPPTRRSPSSDADAWLPAAPPCYTWRRCGGVAQWESIAFASQGSGVRIPSPPPAKVNGGPRIEGRRLAFPAPALWLLLTFVLLVDALRTHLARAELDPQDVVGLI